MEYSMEIAGVKRSLPLCKVNDELFIAAFVIFGDTELTIACAGALLKKAPDFDCILTAEAKGIPLAYEMARQSGKPYIVARKMSKLYMSEVFEVQVKSITTSVVQRLYIDKKEADSMTGKRILLVDDVISTGESLLAIEKLAEYAKGTVAGKMAVLAEGDAAARRDIVFLETLPLFNPKGEAL